MDQSQVTQRKKGKGKEPTTGHTNTESSSSSGDIPTTDTANLPGFSAEQTQSLNDTLDNAVSPLQGHVTKELANQVTRMDQLEAAMEATIKTKMDQLEAKMEAKMDRLQALLEKAISFKQSDGETATKQASSLPAFSTEPAQQPAPQPATPTPSKFKPIKQSGSNSQRPNPSPEPNFGGTPPQISFPARAQMSRWRPEELGTFDPDQDDLYSFIHRIREVADLRDLRTVQLNISLQLRGKAKNWFEIELTHADHTALYDPANEVDEWIERLAIRFKPSTTLLLQQLHETSYTRQDAAASKDPEEYVHKIMKLTRTRPLEESLMEAYLRFESGLQVNLVPPTTSTTVADFMDQIKAKKAAWFRNYSGFRKKDDNPANQTTSNQTRGYQNGYRQQQYNQQRQQGLGNSLQGAPKTDSNPSRYGAYPTQPKPAYHQTVLSPEDFDEQDDYEMVDQ